jgi:signal transduction histidine kinase
MGLPIAKAIVEAHGGTLRVFSRVGHGSIFTFTLPTEGRLDISDKGPITCSDYS